MKCSVNRPRVCFIATREATYSRVAIVRKALNENFEVDELLASQRSYPVRFAILAVRLLLAWVSGRLRRADVIVVGFFAQPVFPLVRLLYRGPVIADAYFSMYDTMINDKQRAKPGSPLARICYWLDRHMLRRAELCLTDTNEHVEYLRNSFDAPQAKVQRLWISADSKPINWNRPAPKHNEPFEVFFWGGFIPLQGVDTIIRAASLLNEVGQKFQFTIFGTGQTYAECVALSNELGTDNVEFCGWQSPDEISARAARSHVALGIFGTTAKAARVIPNKAYEALAMGVPLVTRDSAAARELLVDGDTAMLVDPCDEVGLSESLIWCRDNWTEVCQIARNGQRLFESTCSPTQINKLIADSVHQTWHLTERERNATARPAKQPQHTTRRATQRSR